MAEERFISPIAREGPLRANQTGRSQIADISELREDFAEAIRHTMTAAETIQTLIAVRPNRTGATATPASVLVATDRALLYLHEPWPTQAAHYGIRARVIPYRAIVVAELGQQLLQGTFLVNVLGGARTIAPSFSIHEQSGGALEITYHTLDDRIFVDLLRDLRRLANL